MRFRETKAAICCFMLAVCFFSLYVLSGNGIEGPIILDYDDVPFEDMSTSAGPSLLANLSDNPAYLENFSLTAAFEAKMQFPDGGIDESEDIHYLNTDNTLEAIWIWSRYYTLTKDNTYFDNITAAWNYSITNPAWLESDSGKVYSCAWALRAELEFRRAYGNSTYLWYAQTCANYISSRNGWEPVFWLEDWGKNDIRGLAAGNLYDWAREQGDSTLRRKAIEMGNQTQENITANPSWLSMEDWALAGGVAYWGIIRSAFREYPNVTWAEQYGALLPINVSSPGGGPGNSQCGWYAWYSLGHFAAWEITGNTTHLNHFVNMTGYLIILDGDRDGGVPTNFGDPDDTDESWVTSYRALNLGEILLPWIGFPPEPPIMTQVEHTGSGNENVTLTWNLSPQDWILGDVMRYDVHRGQLYNSSGSGYSVIGSTVAGERMFVDVGAGTSPLNYFYTIMAVDTEWKVSSLSNQGGRIHIPLIAGHNLISIPLEKSDYSIVNLLLGVPFDYIRVFNAFDSISPWSSFHTGRLHQSLTALTLGAGFWINTSSASDLVVVGLIPNQVTLQLKAGWNLIGYCSMISKSVDETLAGIPWVGVRTLNPNASPYYLKKAEMTDTLDVGQGFWVHVSSDTSILFSNS